MNKVTLDEIVGLQRYDEMRPAFRQRIIEMKKHRRVTVGEHITFVFENHDTMLFQIQEMLRAEHIVDLDRVRDEIDVYNALVPTGSELSATMLIELTEMQRIRSDLVRLIGIDSAVRLELGKQCKVGAQFEAGRSKDDKLSAVQYVRFPLDGEARDLFVHRTDAVRLVIDHPNYQASAPIDGAVRESLVRDLETP